MLRKRCKSSRVVGSFLSFSAMAAGLLCGARDGGAQLVGFSTNIATQTSIGVSCSEPGCDCFVNGVPTTCPGTDVENFDSGTVAGPSSHAYAPFVSGHFIGFDANTDVDAAVNGSADFGTLHAYSSASALASGSYVLAGGLAISTTGWASTSTNFSDRLTLTGPPGLPVSITFTQSVSTLTSTYVSTGTGTDPCLANGASTIRLNSSIGASSLFTSDFGVDSFSRAGSVGGVGSGCVALHDTGSPYGSITLNLHVGDMVNFYQSLQTFAEIRLDGGLGAPTNPNRALEADSVLDASNTAKLYIDVLTPGASYTTASGTVYRTPEPSLALGLPAGILVLISLSGARRREASARPSQRVPGPTA